METCDICGRVLVEDTELDFGMCADCLWENSEPDDYTEDELDELFGASGGGFEDEFSEDD